MAAGDDCLEYLDLISVKYKKHYLLCISSHQHSLSGQWRLPLGEIWLCESQWHLHMGPTYS